MRVIILISFYCKNINTMSYEKNQNQVQCGGNQEIHDKDIKEQ